MDPISIALGLASVAPTIVRWITGSDKAEAVANQVLGVAQSLTGKGTPQDAVNALLSDPEARGKFLETWKEIELGLYQAETQRLAEVNSTIRAEIASGDPFVRRARSAFLWAMAGTWTLQGAALAFAVVASVSMSPESRKALYEGMAEFANAMSDHWLYALAVTGVAVWARTTDKQTATGVGGFFAKIGGVFKGSK